MKNLLFLIIILSSLIFGALHLPSSQAQKTASAASTETDNSDAAETTNDKSSDKGFTSDFFTNGIEKGPRPVGLKNVRPLYSRPGKDKVEVDIVVDVPHNKEQKNEFTIYPYPVEPIEWKKTPVPLPEKYQPIKNQLLSSGYNAPLSLGLKPYPTYGWRWHYAFQAALKSSGLGVPHVISEMYQWADDMIRYIKPECVRANQAERDRKSKYDQAMKDYKETSEEIQTQATHEGRFETPVVFTTFSGRVTRNATEYLLPGKWWIVGTHKVPGLKYYWQYPFEVTAGEPGVVRLKESNALYIEGAW
jgi:hypothetical protein